MKKSLRGYETLLTIMAMLPATTGEIAAKLKCSRHQTGQFMRALRQVRLAHRCAAVRVEGARSAIEARYGLGDGPEAVFKGWDKGTVPPPTATAIALASLVAALKDGPSLVTDLVDETGISRMVVQRILRNMEALGLARIGSWAKVPCAVAPMWQWGGGASARRPGRTPRAVVNARAWARRRERLRQKAVESALFFREAA